MSVIVNNLLRFIKHIIMRCHPHRPMKQAKEVE